MRCHAKASPHISRLILYSPQRRANSHSDIRLACLGDALLASSVVKRALLLAKAALMSLYELVRCYDSAAKQSSGEAL